jgi:hypothetical protein
MIVSAVRWVNESSIAKFLRPCKPFLLATVHPFSDRGKRLAWVIRVHGDGLITTVHAYAHVRRSGRAHIALWTVPSGLYALGIDNHISRTNGAIATVVLARLRKCRNSDEKKRYEQNVFHVYPLI